MSSMVMPRTNLQRSAARPCTYAPHAAASPARSTPSVICARRVATIPVRTSPLPPVARAAVPEALTYLAPDLEKTTVGDPLSRTAAPVDADTSIPISNRFASTSSAVSYTHLRAHETTEHLVCRLLLEK